jgi:SAM-dependent methyltransferase
MFKNKYWAPIKQNLTYIESLIKPDAKVLEIGPGRFPFSKATHFCGWSTDEKNKFNNYKTVNIAEDIFPYEDKEFDFVYCRHVIEDLWNPINALKEILRITKAGYIETPSPLCETAKGVDATNINYRGYAHHRYFVWNDSGVLNILPKFPIVETDFFQSKIFLDDEMEEILQNPFYWNTFFYFKDDLKYKFYDMGKGKDFVFDDQSYFKIIRNGIMAGITNVKNQMENIYDK